jgi:hypothetical protein
MKRRPFDTEYGQPAVTADRHASTAQAGALNYDAGSADDTNGLYIQIRFDHDRCGAARRIDRRLNRRELLRDEEDLVLGRGFH